MTGLLLLLAAIIGLTVSLIVGSEIWATVSLVAAGVIILAGVLGAYARLGLWLWGL